MSDPQTSFPFPTGDKPKVQSLAEQCREDGIMLMYVFDREYPTTGGFTIAYRPSRIYKSTKMVDIAVSTCASGERFNKKIGRDIALRRFLNGEFIQVPALRYGEDYVHDEIRSMFTHFID